ncbi:MAG: hypothetical protein V4510_04805 [bacterium]
MNSLPPFSIWLLVGAAALAGRATTPQYRNYTVNDACPSNLEGHCHEIGGVLAQATTTIRKPICTGSTYTHELAVGVEAGFDVGPVKMKVTAQTTLPLDTWYTWSCTVDWSIIATGHGGVARTVWAVAQYEDCGTNVVATTPAESGGTGRFLTNCPVKDHRLEACGYDGVQMNGCANPAIGVGTSSFSGHGNVLGAATQAPNLVNLGVQPERAQSWNEMNPYTGLGTVKANASNTPCTPATILHVGPS